MAGTPCKQVLMCTLHWRNSLANYKIHHAHIHRSTTPTADHINVCKLYIVRERSEKMNNYKNYHNNVEVSVCGWTAGTFHALFTVLLLPYDFHNDVLDYQS